jgi:protein tyrosine phosphatase
MGDKYREVFQILADRENKRNRYGRSRSDSVGPEKAVNYAVANSFKYERSNRYSNILSYDKTSVKVRGKGYLNANIVVARNGHWWVAAQVSRVISRFGIC